MPEYIERNKLFEAIKNESMTQFDWSEKVDLEEFEKVLNNIPTADVVEAKHGKWIEHLHFSFEGSYTGVDYECSRCGYNDYVDEEYNYCPNCGAKMEM